MLPNPYFHKVQRVLKWSLWSLFLIFHAGKQKTNIALHRWETVTEPPLGRPA